MARDRFWRSVDRRVRRLVRGELRGYALQSWGRVIDPDVDGRASVRLDAGGDVLCRVASGVSLTSLDRVLVVSAPNREPVVTTVVGSL